MLKSRKFANYSVVKNSYLRFEIQDFNTRLLNRKDGILYHLYVLLNGVDRFVVA